MRTAILALLLAALPVSGQYRESLDVSILELDVVVLDRSGRPIEGLMRDDFEVRVAGRTAEVSNFFAVTGGAIVTGEAGAASRRAVPDETMIPTTVVIFLDDTRLGHRSKTRAISALREYLASNLGPVTTAMIIRWNRRALDVRTRPSERAGLLLAELERYGREPALLTEFDRQSIIKAIDDALLGVTGNERMHAVQNAWIQLMAYADREAREVEETLDALREAIDLASAFEGRKSLVYVSEGLPMSPAADIFDYWDRMTRMMGTQGLNAALMEDVAEDLYNSLDPLRYDRSYRFVELSRHAQSRNVQVYAIDAGGVRGFDHGSLQQASLVSEINTLAHRSNLQDGVRLIAKESGGRFIANENDLGKALGAVSEQFSTYYSLGLRRPSRGKLEKVEVTVRKHPGARIVTARHRRPLTHEEEIEQAVRSRLYLRREDNRHAVELGAGVALPAGDRCVVSARVTIPRANLLPAVSSGSTALRLHFAMLDEANQESHVQRMTVFPGPEGNVSQVLSLGVKPGRYMLSLAVDDPAGETSYLQREIDATRCR